MQKGFSVAASELVHDKTNARLKVCTYVACVFVTTYSTHVEVVMQGYI